MKFFNVSLFVTWLVIAAPLFAEEADLILHNGRIVTVNSQFDVAEAMAVKGERVLAVGTNAEVLKTKGPNTIVRDLAGGMVLPGLIDSHTHPTGASMYEYDHDVPDMENMADLLKYVSSRADLLEDGEWISIRQVFITRLREQRYPSRAELDGAAPKNPVVFSTGPDAMLNSLALEASGIGKGYKVTDGGNGYVELDPETDEPTGLLRSCGRLIKSKSSGKSASSEERYDRLKALFAKYNEVGLTGISDRSTSDGAVALYEKLMENGDLTCRTFLYYGISPNAPLDQIQERLDKASNHPRHAYNNRLWLRGIKMFLDGGMLTGSAYMLEPWGVSETYLITDPKYRGLLYIPEDKLAAIAKLALERDLQVTAHAVGDGAVEALINAYVTVNEELPVKGRRPCVTHCNFMSAKGIAIMKELGIVADLQPAWLYLDGRTLTRQFGPERMTYFQPYKTCFDEGVIVGGGSDHMQKLGDMRSINPYNPFWGMWVTMTRHPRWTDDLLHPEQIINREQALKLYTINNAFITFEEKEKGSLEAGKLADFILIDRDYLKCPLEEVKEIRVQETWVGGEKVFSRDES